MRKILYFTLDKSHGGGAKICYHKRKEDRFTRFCSSFKGNGGGGNLGFHFYRGVIYAY